jgi:glycine/sarcosine N-methyltransferase
MTAARFYDRLARDYHLLYPDWRQAQDEQAAAILALVEKSVGPAAGPMLDAACGTGTQALGLAARGCTVHGIDVSAASVRRARREARGLGLRAAAFRTGDMRRLPPSTVGAFAAVIACDNPLAHLLSPDDLAQAARCLRAALKPGGVLVLSSRDYDAFARERPTVMAFRQRTAEAGRIVIWQLWDWQESSPLYRSTHFIVRQHGTRWLTSTAVTTMRAWQRDEIRAAFQEAGFREARWLEPAESRYFQPVMTAVAADA